jgi:hypothetical protein
MNLSRVILSGIRIGTKTEFLLLLYPFSYFRMAAPIVERLKSIWTRFSAIQCPSNDRFHRAIHRFTRSPRVELAHVSMG